MSERRKVLEEFYRQEDFMREKVREGIEKHRKGGCSITLTDKNGAPIKGAKIKVVQKTHEFRYGANLFMLDELETKEKNDLYKKYMSSFGNMATLPFYWDATEPQKGKTRYSKDSEKLYRRPPIDLCMEFCNQHGIEPREHALAYEAFFPKWLYDSSIDEIKSELEKRYKEISELYADKISTIEVTNEMKWDKGRTAFYDSDEYVEWCFKLAEKYFPNNQLVINEWTDLSWSQSGTETDTYYSYIKDTLCRGARIDAIGMQYHMFHQKQDEYAQTRPFYSPENLYRHMDLYSTFGKPLQVTEVTVPAYSNSAEDEQIQAEIIENLFSIWFSHPNVEQIIYWNMIDGYAHLWDPSPEKIAASQGDMTLGENYYYGGLLRFDLTPKPAYFAIKNLFEKKWHTEEELVTDQNGRIEFSGFYGDYELEITANGQSEHKKITLSSKKNNENHITWG